MPLPASLQLSTVTGPSTRKGREGEIEVVALRHEVKSAIDEKTGLPADERAHELFTIVKEVDIASAELRKAHAEGRVFERWVLRFFHQSQFGPVAHYATTTLVKARIAAVKLVMPRTFDVETAPLHETEEISWSYDSIVWATPAPPEGAEDADTWDPATSSDTVLRFEPDWVEAEAKKALEKMAEVAKEQGKKMFEEELKAREAARPRPAPGAQGGGQ